MMKRLILLSLIIVIISGCAKENKEISLLNTPKGSNSSELKLEQGYLYKDSTHCLFFDLKASKAYHVKISPFDVNNNDISYTINDKDIFISLLNKTFSGTIENDYISLKIMNSDGTISYQRFNKATIIEYNKTVEKLKQSQKDIDNMHTLNQIKGVINDNMDKLENNIKNIKSYDFDLSDINNSYKKAQEKYNIWLNSTSDKDLKYGDLEVSIGSVESSFGSVEVKYTSLNDDIDQANFLIDDIKSYLESYKLTSGKPFENKIMMDNYNSYIKTCKSYKEKNTKYLENAKVIKNKAYKLK